VSIVTRLRTGRSGFDSRLGQEFSSPPRPDWLWGPPSEYRGLFPGGRATGA
jgi:hypothetical protein